MGTPNRFSRVSKRDKHQRFSIRKFNVGVASVAIAAFWMVGGQAVAADSVEVVESAETVLVDETAVGDADSTAEEADAPAEEEAEAQEVEAELKVEAEAEIEADAEVEAGAELKEEAEVEAEVETEAQEAEVAEESQSAEKEAEESKAAAPAEEVAAPVTRTAKVNYQVLYIDEETGVTEFYRNYRASEETTAAAEELQTLNVSINLEVPEGFVAVSAADAAGQELAIVNNAIQAAIVEGASSSDRTFKVSVRKDGVTATAPEEGYTMLRAVADQKDEAYIYVVGYDFGYKFRAGDNRGEDGNDTIAGSSTEDTNYWFYTKGDHSQEEIKSLFEAYLNDAVYFVGSGQHKGKIDERDIPPLFIPSDRWDTDWAYEYGEVYQIDFSNRFALSQKAIDEGYEIDWTSLRWTNIPAGAYRVDENGVLTFILVAGSEHNSTGVSYSLEAKNPAGDVITISGSDIGKYAVTDTTKPVLKVTDEIYFVGDEVTEDFVYSSVDSADTNKFYVFDSSGMTTGVQSHSLNASHVFDFEKLLGGEPTFIKDRALADALIDVTGLPAGLGWDALDGAVTGSPELPGIYEVEAKVTDWADSMAANARYGNPASVSGAKFYTPESAEAAYTITVYPLPEPEERTIHVSSRADILSDYTPEELLANEADWKGEREVTYKDGTTRVIPYDFTLADGATFKFKEGASIDATKEGDVEVPIVVTYPNGDTREVNAIIHVIDDAPVAENTGLDDQAYGATVDLLAPFTVKDFEDDRDDNFVTTVVYTVTTPSGDTKEVTVEELAAFELTETGTYTVKAVATDPQGKTDDTEYSFKVYSIADITDPEAGEETNPVQATNPVEAKDLVTTELPEGTVVEYKDPSVVDSTKVGEYPVVLVVTYPDGSVDELDAKVIFTNVPPTAEDEGDKEAMLGDKLDLLSLITVADEEDDKVSDDSLVKTVVYTVTTPAGETKVVTEDELKDFTFDETGEYVVKTVVTDSQDQVAETEFKVTVKSLADITDPEAGEETNPVQGTNPVEAKDLVTTELPEGTVVEYKDPSVVDSTKVGEYPVVLVVTYPDGSVDELDAKVIFTNVPPTAEDEGDKEAMLGDKLDLLSLITVADEEDDNVSDDSLVKTVVYTVTTPAGETKVVTEDELKDFTFDETGDYTVKTVVTDSQDQVAETEFKVTVKSLADITDPEAGEETNPVQGTNPVEAKDLVTTELPEGTVVEYKDPSVVDSTKVGEYPVVLVITYPDGSVDEVDAKVIFTNVPPTAEDEGDKEAMLGDKLDLLSLITVTDEEDDNVSDDSLVKTVVYTVTTPAGETKVVTEDELKDFTFDQTGEYVVKTEVTDSQDQVAETEFKVTVKSLADITDPEAGEETNPVQATNPVEAKDLVTTELPEGTVVEYKDPSVVDSTKVGEYPVVLVVTYTDGTVDEVDAKVIFTNVPPTAEDEGDKDAMLGDKLDLLSLITVTDEEDDNVSDDSLVKTVVYTVTTPSGETKVVTEDELKDFTFDETGDYTVKTVVTDSQDQVAETEFKVTVKSLADITDPKAGEETNPVQATNPVEAKDLITSELPEGTVVEYKDPSVIDSTKVGEYPVVLVITYTDGTVDEVDAKVIFTNVPPTAEDEGDKDAMLGDKLDLLSLITVADEEDDNVSDDSLVKTVVYTVTTPVGETKVVTEDELKDFTFDQTGEYVVKTVVTDSQDQVAETAFKVTVKSLADITDPEAGEETHSVQATNPVEAKDLVTTELPEGTVVEYKDPSVVDSTKVGEYPVVLVITYTDGTVDEVDAKVIFTNVPPTAEDEGDKDAMLGDKLDLLSLITVADEEDDKVSDDSLVKTVVYTVTTPSGETKVVTEDELKDFTFDETGDYTVKTVVTDSQDQVAETEFKVTVKSLADITDPEAVEETNPVQATNPVEAKDLITSELPEGTVVEYKDPSVIDSTKVGEYPVVLVITYTDGSVDEVDAKVIFTNVPPTAEDEGDKEVMLGDKLDLLSLITVADEEDDNVSDDSLVKTVVYTVTTPSGETKVVTEDELKDFTFDQTGDYVVKTVVTDSQDQVAETEFKVTVKSLADITDPGTGEETNPVQGTNPVEAKDLVTTELPEGTVVEYKDPSVIDPTKVGEYPVVLVITYTDGSVDEVDAKVIFTNVPPTAEDEGDKEVMLGDKLDLLSLITVADEEDDKVSDDSLVKAVVYTVTTPSGETKVVTEDELKDFTFDQTGEYVVKTVVTDSQDQVAETAFTVTVKSLADITDPEAVEETNPVQATNPVEAKDLITSELPEGTVVEYKDPSVIDSTKFGEYPVVLVVTYPDGSVDEVDAKVIFTNVPPTAEDQGDKEAMLGDKLDLLSLITVADEEDDKVSDDTLVKAVVYTVTSPSGETKVVTEDELKDFTFDQTGDYVVKTVVTDSQDQVTETAFTVTVKSLADITDPEAVEETNPVQATNPVEAKDLITSELPEGTVVEYKDPSVIDSTKFGEYPVVVVVTYPDGSVDEVDAKVIFTNVPPTAEDEGDKEVMLGDKLDLLSLITVADEEDDKVSDDSLVKAVVYTVTTPSGEVTVVTEDELANFVAKETGTYTIHVLVTDSQGETAETTYELLVKSQAEISVPEIDTTKDAIPVQEGNPIEAKDLITDFDKLPEGTTVTYKTPVDTTTVGDKEVVLVVTYPDGTVDEVVAVIKVINEGPTASSENQEAMLGETVDLLKVVKTSDKEDDLKSDDSLVKSVVYTVTTPSGETKVVTEDELANFVAKETGTYTIHVLVTDSQGEPAETTYELLVKSQAEISVPEIDTTKDAIPVQEGNPIEAKDLITDFDKLPEGTTVTYKTPVDTTTVGDKEVVLVVTYPDGTVDEVVAVIKVINEGPTASSENQEAMLGETVDLLKVVKTGDKEDDLKSDDSLVKSVVYTVTTPSGETKVVTEDELANFVADEVGTYTIHVLVTDSQGETAETTYELVVKAQEKEEEPKDVETPEDEKPTESKTDKVPTTDKKVVKQAGVKAPAAKPQAAKSELKELPNTGEETSLATQVGIGLLMSVFGLAGLRRRKED